MNRRSISHSNRTLKRVFAISSMISNDFYGPPRDSPRYRDTFQSMVNEVAIKFKLFSSIRSSELKPQTQMTFQFIFKLRDTCVRHSPFDSDLLLSSLMLSLVTNIRGSTGLR